MALSSLTWDLHPHPLPVGPGAYLSSAWDLQPLLGLCCGVAAVFLPHRGPRRSSALTSWPDLELASSPQTCLMMWTLGWTWSPSGSNPCLLRYCGMGAHPALPSGSPSVPCPLGSSQPLPLVSVARLKSQRGHALTSLKPTLKCFFPDLLLWSGILKSEKFRLSLKLDLLRLPMFDKSFRWMFLSFKWSMLADTLMPYKKAIDSSAMRSS